MNKLEKLTPEQENKMQEIKQFWTDYIFSCKNQVNIEAARIGINWMYKLAGKNEPVIIHVQSPMGCQFAVHYLKEYMKALEVVLGPNAVRTDRTQVWDQVGDQVWDQVRTQVWDQVWTQVGDQVGEPVRVQVGDQVWTQKLEFTNFAGYGSIRDYGWVSFYDFFTQIGVIDHAGFNQFKNVLLSGIYDMIQLNGFCIVSSLPTKIIRNSSNRLHNPAGPAIEFADGYKQYYINGRALPAWIWEKAAAGQITREMFLKEPNSEIKGGIYEVLGQKGMMELLGAEEVDSQIITHRNGDLETVTLLKTKERFKEIENQPFAWVKMVCPSTGTQYLQGVEPHHKKAVDAMASLSMFSVDEYSFDFRS